MHLQTIINLICQIFSSYQGADTQLQGRNTDSSEGLPATAPGSLQGAAEASLAAAGAGGGAPSAAAPALAPRPPVPRVTTRVMSHQVDKT